MKRKAIWTRFQSYVPCKEDGCNRHYACHLWETGWRVGVKRFLFFKWLEFTK